VKEDVAAALITEKGGDTIYPARRVKPNGGQGEVTMASFDDKADWMRIIRDDVLLSESGCPRLTMAQTQEA
jgi:hypothetical protein